MQAHRQAYAARAMANTLRFWRIAILGAIRTTRCIRMAIPLIGLSPDRTKMRAEMFLRFMAAIVVGCLGAVTSSLGQTRETMALVPVDDHYYGKIYDKLVSACTASLISSAGKAGVNAATASWSADSNINTATYRIYVGTNWALQQEHYFNLWSRMAALDLPSAFSGPEQFASFMTETPAYRRLRKESGENSKGSRICTNWLESHIAALFM